MAIPPQIVHDLSLAVCENLCELPVFQKAETVLVYLSTSHEVDTSQIALRAWDHSKRVLAPRVSWEQRRMLPVEIKSLTSDVRDGGMGLREPVEGMPVPVSEIDLVIVPGLGFDPHGNRLGRGRGFYDRFLSHRDSKGVSCGVAFESQVVESIPSGPHDIRVKMLVTDAKVRQFNR
jgi:5-formyltetrahydrofolate cyclo-ligase